MAKSTLLVSTAVSLTMIVGAQLDAFAQPGPQQDKPKRGPGHPHPCGSTPAGVFASRNPALAPVKSKPMHEKFALNTSRQFVYGVPAFYICIDETSKVNFTCSKACVVDIKTVSQIGPAYGYDVTYFCPIVDGSPTPDCQKSFEEYPNAGAGSNAVEMVSSVQLKAGLHQIVAAFYFSAPTYWGISETDYHVYEK